MREPYLQTGFVRLCWQKLFHLMVLNGLFLLCSAGVLTIPAALTALSRGCQALLLEEPHPFRGFFRAFREACWASSRWGCSFRWRRRRWAMGACFMSKTRRSDRFSPRVPSFACCGAA